MTTGHVTKYQLHDQKCKQVQMVAIVDKWQKHTNAIVHTLRGVQLRKTTTAHYADNMTHKVTW